MPILFESTAGRVVQFNDPAAQCTMQLYDINPTITFQAQNSIVTRLTVSQRVNAQFLHTIGSDVYIYVFGDRIGQISLSGLGFTCVCAYATSGGNPPGGDLMYQWYKKNRASKRPNPIIVTVGTQTIEGWMMDFTEDVIDPSTSLVQWNLNMVTLPGDD